MKCAVRINNRLTNWFNVSCGLKQGCSLSSILFNLYINDLIERITAHNIGIDINGEKIGILLYAGDAVLLAESENDLQILLDELHIWCQHNKMIVNPGKSKIVHFRVPSVNCTNMNFTCGNDNLQTVKQYVYLGLVLT